MTPGLNSAIYEGVVTHRRLLPHEHSFSYGISMVYLDLDELDAVFARSWLWSLERFNLAAFHRKDYLGDPAVTHAEAVRGRIKAATGRSHSGRIRMLGNLRYFGFIINPVTCYYCFDPLENLQFIVAEVTNTPWRERYSYVLEVDGLRPVDSLVFAKQMHVSPFMPMCMNYVWSSTVPSGMLTIRMEVHGSEGRQFIAGLNMRRSALTTRAMRRLLWRYPLMTMQIGLAIYWQALRLWLKKVPVFFHPRRTQELPQQTAAANKPTGENFEHH